jgi:hypothetical protein
VDKTVGESGITPSQVFFDVGHLQKPLRHPLSTPRRRCKFMRMGVKIDIDEVRAARQAVGRRLEELEQEIAKLRSEAEDFDTTLRILHRLHPNAGKPLDEESGQESVDEDDGLPRGALRRHIETALNTFAFEGASVSAIREYIQTRHGLDIQPNTISVTLNRLKTQGTARLEGQKWSPIRSLRAARDQWDSPPTHP